MFCGPSAPPAPGLFSMTMRLPRWRAATSASARKAMSVLPPGVHGHINVIGRSGKLSAVCACRVLAAASITQAHSARANRSGGIGIADGMRQLHFQAHALDDSLLFVVKLLRELRVVFAVF